MDQLQQLKEMYNDKVIENIDDKLITLNVLSNVIDELIDLYKKLSNDTYKMKHAKKGNNERNN